MVSEADDLLLWNMLMRPIVGIQSCQLFLSFMDTDIDPDHFYTFKKDPVKEYGSVTANPSSSFLKENKVHAFLVVGQKMSSLHWKVSNIFMVDSQIMLHINSTWFVTLSFFLVLQYWEVAFNINTKSYTKEYC